MCGICGMAALDGELDPSIKSAVSGMAHALRHRGPDGDGFFSDSHAALGHRRLAIIDRAGGAQPMANEDGTIHIVFNGEVYNHHLLRAELEARGHVFRTAFDTETIIHAYEEYGEGCAERLDGMFAFAIWNQKARELYIARDRLGKKPLFYASLGGVFHFASEMKAFAASPVWDDAVDLSALEGYLSLGYFLAPQTIYQHARKLEPAHWLRVRDGRVETRRYWDISRFDDDARDEPAVLEELDSLLRGVVEARLESEVPLGAFLSGGVDSGLVVSFMAQAGIDRLVTTSVGFAEAAHNELHAAGLTASRFSSVHHAEVVDPKLEEVLDEVVGSFDEPFADSSAIPTYYVSKIARRHVTVALTGDGGDEAFGGYDFRYQPHAMEARIRKFVPGAPGRAALRAVGARWPRHPRLPRPLRLGAVLENLGRDSATAYYADLCFMKPGAARALLGQAPRRNPADSPVFAAVVDPYRRCASASPLQRAQYADLMVYLPNDPLVKVDRMSMAHSLEIRCPLLDHRVIEFAFRLPSDRKMPQLRPKHLLRELAARRLPPELSTLPKRGFTAPVGAWIAGPYAESFRSDVLRPGVYTSSWLDMERVRSLFDEHRTRFADHSYALWTVWMLERWAMLRGRGGSKLRRVEAATA